MDQLLFIQTGTGTDVHGQDITKASVRAIENAIHTNSMPGIREALPNQSLDNMKTNIKLGLPTDIDLLDEAQIRKAIPYGEVADIKVVDGGMTTTSGIILEDKDDDNDQMYIVNASVEVGY